MGRLRLRLGATAVADTSERQLIRIDRLRRFWRNHCRLDSQGGWRANLESPPDGTRPGKAPPSRIIVAATSTQHHRASEYGDPFPGHGQTSASAFLAVSRKRTHGHWENAHALEFRRLRRTGNDGC